MSGPVGGVAAAPEPTVTRSPRRAFDGPRVVLFAAIGVWAITLDRLGTLRQNRFGTFGFDLGIYDQAIWLLSRLKDPFITVRGLEAFGNHVNVVFFVLAPFYRLGAGPKFLLFVQVVAQASGAGAVFLLARDRIGDRWLATALGTVYLLHPTSQWLVWEYFHPDALAIGPLLFAYWAARERRWGWFSATAVIALSCREDVALVFVVIGLLIAWRGDRRIGLSVSAGSLAWYVVATRVIIPWQNGVGPFYDAYFGTLGTNPLQVAAHLLRHPASTWKLVTQHDRLTYLWHVLAPYAFVPLLSPSTLTLALPILAVNLVSAFPYTRDAHFHYSALVLVGLTIATVEAVARLPRLNAKRALVGVLLVSSFSASVVWGPSPIGRPYRQGWWPLTSSPRYAVDRAAVAMIPTGAPVSASYDYVPHLAHRTRVYEFPVPWRDINWGVHGEHLDDPSHVQWLLVDRRLLDSDGQSVLYDLLRHQFAVRSEVDGIVVAQRVHAGPPP